MKTKRFSRFRTVTRRGMRVGRSQSLIPRVLELRRRSSQRLSTAIEQSTTGSIVYERQHCQAV